MMDAEAQIYREIHISLMNDEKPSIFLQALFDHGALETHPFTMLSRLKKVEQSKEHHPEGNVWNHTLLVTDEAAKVKGQSGAPEAFMWAALLHDLGKALTTKRSRGKITAYNHEKVGADLAREFLHCFTEQDDFIESVGVLIRWHMEILFVTKGLRFADIAGMKREADMHEVALLGLCDRLGRKGVDQAKEQETILAFLKIVSGTEALK